MRFFVCGFFFLDVLTCACMLVYGVCVCARACTYHLVLDMDIGLKSGLNTQYFKPELSLSSQPRLGYFGVTTLDTLYVTFSSKATTMPDTPSQLLCIVLILSLPLISLSLAFPFFSFQFLFLLSFIY